VCGSILIVNAAGRVEPRCWASMEGASELVAQGGGSHPAWESFPTEHWRDTLSLKPCLVLHLPVINEKWLVALHLKNGIQGSPVDPWLIRPLPWSP